MTNCWAEFNGDGIADLVIETRTYEQTGKNRKIEFKAQDYLNVYLGNGDGTFEISDTVAVKTGSHGVGDFDGDGLLDVLAGGGQLLRGLGDGTLNEPPTVPKKRGHKASAPAVDEAGAIQAVGDFDADGCLDFISETGTYLGNGQGDFTFARTLPVVGEVLATGDVNNDGLTDLVIIDRSVSNYTFTIVLGNGDGTFTDDETHTTDTLLSWVLAVDVDNDGWLDLIYRDGEGLALLLNDGNW